MTHSCSLENDLLPTARISTHTLKRYEMSPIWRWSSKILAVILLVGPHVVRSNLKVKEVNPFMIAPNDNVKTADIITTEKKVTEEPGESSPGLRTMNRELGTSPAWAVHFQGTAQAKSPSQIYHS